VLAGIAMQLPRSVHAAMQCIAAICTQLRTILAGIFSDRFVIPHAILNEVTQERIGVASSIGRMCSARLRTPGTRKRGYMDTGHHGGRRLILLLLVALALPVLPILPARTVLAATRTVDSLSDTAVDAGHCTDAIAGNCTLRDAISAALPGDTITFASGLTGTITLTASRGSLTLDKNLTIQGPGRDLLFISGGCTTCGPGGARSNGVRVFTVNGGVTATIGGVTITKGRATDGGGGIKNDYNGTLTVADSTITGNATGDGDGNGGRGGPGGGIANYGTVTLTGSTVSNNITGNGGSTFTTPEGGHGVGF
jgi:hypothetical protein